VKRNFDELFSKMKPEAQERARVRSSELLREMALADLSRAQTEIEVQTEPELTPTIEANKTS